MDNELVEHLGCDGSICVDDAGEDQLGPTGGRCPGISVVSWRSTPAHQTVYKSSFRELL